MFHNKLTTPVLRAFVPYRPFIPTNFPSPFKLVQRALPLPQKTHMNVRKNSSLSLVLPSRWISRYAVGARHSLIKDPNINSASSLSRVIRRTFSSRSPNTGSESKSESDHERLIEAYKHSLEQKKDVFIQGEDFVHLLKSIGATESGFRCC